MTIGLLVALAVMNVAWLVVLDRKDRRHDQVVDRLAQRVSAPMTVIDPPQGPVAQPVFRNEFTEEQEHLEELEPHMMVPFIGDV